RLGQSLRACGRAAVSEGVVSGAEVSARICRGFRAVRNRKPHGKRSRIRKTGGESDRKTLQHSAQPERGKPLHIQVAATVARQNPLVHTNGHHAERCGLDLPAKTSTLCLDVSSAAPAPPDGQTHLTSADESE